VRPQCEKSHKDAENQGVFFLISLESWLFEVAFFALRKFFNKHGIFETYSDVP
jgi:hypothetical protein